MRKNIFLILLFCVAALSSVEAKEYLISTKRTSLLITAEEGKMSTINYYGGRIEQEDIADIDAAGMKMSRISYPMFGITSSGERAINVTHFDGNMSLDLVVERVDQYENSDANITEVVMKDKVYPFEVKQCYKAYKECDVITTWVEITNNEKRAAKLYRFASVNLPINRADNYLTQFHGSWGAETTMEEAKLRTGQTIIANTEGVRGTQSDNPSFMMTLDGYPNEESGDVIGGVLCWSGNYKIKIVTKNSAIDVIAGINEDNSHYTLEPKETFVTPEFAISFSSEGKGGVSRAFHKWALKYKVNQGDKERDILLNSWEGVYMNVNQKGMDDMMREISAMGGELFVMDDGWFGDKYPRNSGSSSLGDWVVCKQKLPEGIEGLLASADKYKIKFGIWIEPEMVNTKSELYEKHPDWVLGQENRPHRYGRGGTQATLDMTNPEVQDFVFSIVDNLMSEHPAIAYIKWDANNSIVNYGSHYLPKDKQSHIYIDYHRGLNNVLERLRAKYPKLVIQACASGGGRINYGLLPYFNEFWTSDNTDALQRINMQWGVSNFYPAIAMASHASADVNHQTGRAIPLKFRFDVAMSGRLGMEIQPKDMSDEDKAFATRAIASYKKIRPIVQFGELYRLVSPYDKKGISSLMYASEDKNSAALFIYRTEHFINMITPNIKLSGLDPDKKYRITDLTAEDPEKPCIFDGKVISGKVLKDNGISIIKSLNKDYGSLVLQFEAVD